MSKSRNDAPKSNDPDTRETSSSNTPIDTSEISEADLGAVAGGREKIGDWWDELYG